MKGLKGLTGSQLGKGLIGICRSSNGYTPIETLLEGKGFSCEDGGNWNSGKGQGIGCVTFGACDIHPSTTRTKKGGDRSVSPYLDIRRGERG